ncbi:hypothetical protein OAO01_07450 [Oligoflexia bacterium]|nr:hypothetical protein [Oligoflexia bacterium]
MSDSTKTFVLDLIKLVDDLQRLYEEHIESYDELLPHVFFGDLTRYVVSSFESIIGDQYNGQEWKDLDNILKHIENGVSGDDKEIQGLIVVSFLENLDLANRNLKILTERFGPNLKKVFRKIK